MTRYRRLYVPGGTYFFAVNTHMRRPLFAGEAARDCLRHAFEETRLTRPFDVVALCLLPNHLHAIWTLPPDDDDYSTRWSAIKTAFSTAYAPLAGAWSRPAQSLSRDRRRRRPFWQRGGWEHTITDEDDFARHMDYTHYNPVKHGLVKRVVDWPWSTFHRYAKEGIYPEHWGASPDDWMLDLDTSGE